MPFVIHEVKQFRRFCAANPPPQPGLPLLGQTHLTPEQRSSTMAAGRYVFRYGLVPHDQGEGGGDRDAPDQLSETAWVRGVVELDSIQIICVLVTHPTIDHAPHWSRGDREWVHRGRATGSPHSILSLRVRCSRVRRARRQCVRPTPSLPCCHLPGNSKEPEKMNALAPLVTYTSSMFVL